MRKAIAVTHSELVRSYVERTAIVPARRAGQSEFAVKAGDVHRALGLSNRVPLVCQALRSKQLLVRNGLELKSEKGPRSGLSTTMEFTYRFVSPGTHHSSERAGLRGLVGIGKNLWKDWGGGESFLKRERARFDQRERH